MNVMPFNFMDADAATNLTIYPPGDYLFEIIHIEEREEDEEEYRRLMVTNKIIMGPWQSKEHVGKLLHTSFKLTPYGAKFLKRLLHACGITDEVCEQLDCFDSEMLIGRRYVASIFIHGGRMITAGERQFKGSELKGQSAVIKAINGVVPKTRLLIKRFKKASTAFIKVMREDKQ